MLLCCVVLCLFVCFQCFLMWSLTAGDFNVGLSYMLAVRGEGILSWIGDENFVVEDKTNAIHEVLIWL